MIEDYIDSYVLRLRFISFVVDCLPITVSVQVGLKIVGLDEGYRTDSRMLHRVYPVVRALY